MQNMEPAEAVELAMKATDPKDKARIEVVNSQIKETLKDSPELYLDKSQEAFKSLFVWNDPKPNDLNAHKMADEYGNVFESFRRAGSSDADALAKADSYIKRTWGVSTALGKPEVMKYPLDDYYSIDGDSSWVKGQLMADMSDQVAGLQIDEIFLMANDQTSRTASIGQPSYAVKFLIDGVFYNADENWMPDMQTEIEKRKAENVKEAMARRERRREMDAAAADFVRGVK
jgi:hypothetical protein